MYITIIKNRILPTRLIILIPRTLKLSTEEYVLTTPTGTSTSKEPKSEIGSDNGFERMEINYQLHTVK